MRMKRYIIFCCVWLLIQSVCGDLEGPPKKSDKEDESDDEVEKIRKWVSQHTTGTAEETNDESSNEDFDDANFLNAAIKIVRAPDLSKDKGQQVTEILYDILENQAKLIQKMEEEMEETAAMPVSEESLKELTKEEIENENEYQNTLTWLTKDRNRREQAFTVFERLATAGHTGARIQMAWGQLFGNVIKRNVDAAKNTFTELANHGNADAHMGLGFMYAIGFGFPVSQPKALIHYTLSALGGNSFAQMALGYRYWSGITVQNSCEKALDFYRKVATKVASLVTFSGGTAVSRIRLLDEMENPGGNNAYMDNDLLDYYEMMADKGDVNAQVGLGQLYYQGGRGIPVDYAKALGFFMSAAKAGNAMAMAFIGKIYLEGSETVPASNETAMKYFQKSTDLGNPVGQSGLGLMYLHGKGVSRDPAKALTYFSKAAEQGWVDGQLQLGNMYYTGIGVKRDFKLANKFFSLASQSGHVLAYYNLGQMHAAGLGMMRSCPNAVEFFKNVAERGKWGKTLMDAHQDYKAHDYVSSFLQYALLAEMGYEVAQGNAAFILDKGELKLTDKREEEHVRALQYWGRAAAQGYSAAQVKLGDYHYYGLGTPVDYETAASHYRMASDHHQNAQAMFNLGYMHEQGLGMKKDWHLAKRCYDSAAEISADAKIPVALALLKLQILFKLESLNIPILDFVNLNENVQSNWDLYLVTILTLLLGIIMYFHRPPAQPEERARQNQQPERVADRPQPERAAEPVAQPQ